MHPETFNIKRANPANMQEWLPLAITNFTEQEVANILQYPWGINLLDTKAEKLSTAKRVAEQITPWLWSIAASEYRFSERARGARTLARKLESLQGLSSIITLAGVR